MYDATYRIVICGDLGVGKNTFLDKCAINMFKNLFKSDTRMTIGVAFKEKSLEINDKKVKLQIFHLSGEERDRFLLPMYSRGANGALFMYDVTNRTSLVHLDKWLSLARKEMKSEQDAFRTIIVGNKVDLQDGREVTGEEGLEFAKSRGVDGFIECSAKTGENAEETINELTRLMMQRSNLI